MPTNSVAVSPPRLSEAARQFLDYARVELRFGAQTIERYEYCLHRLARAVGQPVCDRRFGRRHHRLRSLLKKLR